MDPKYFLDFIVDFISNAVSQINWSNIVILSILLEPKHNWYKWNHERVSLALPISRISFWLCCLLNQTKCSSRANLNITKYSLQSTIQFVVRKFHFSSLEDLIHSWSEIFLSWMKRCDTSYLTLNCVTICHVVTETLMYLVILMCQDTAVLWQWYLYLIPVTPITVTTTGIYFLTKVMSEKLS